MKKVLIVLIVTFVSLATFGQTTRYVKPTASGLEDGSSWANASADLQAMINASAANDEVWVAAGTHKPTKEIDGTNDQSRFFTFFINTDGIKIYGGFVGTESLLSERNVQNNTTILSGDIGVANDASDNVYHVMYINPVSSSTVIDGFTISDGNANGSAGQGDGGGIYMPNFANGSTSNPTISNCTISNNNANTSGGGVLIYNSSGTVSPTFNNCIFKNNTGGAGGAVNMISWGGTNNTAFNGCLFYDNTALSLGGAVYHHGDNTAANPTFTNCTFTDNTNANGGAFYNRALNSATGQVTMTNCILWSNGSTPIGEDAGTVTGSVINYSIYDDGTANGTVTLPSFITGSNNLDSDPLFTNAANDNFKIGITSPAFNIGDNTAWTATGLTTDLSGTIRPKNGAVDLGAYEAGLDKIYVKANATGTNNGASWNNAFTNLQDALDLGHDGLEIWVAAGTYQPTQAPNGSANTRDYAFHWNTDIKLYGGFAGNETQLSQRNWNTNETILSGDLNSNDVVSVTETNVTLSNYSDNVYHVIITNNLTTASEINGFVIRGGNADGGDFQFITYGTGDYYAKYGGAMINGAASPLMIHNKFLYNYARIGGGAISNYDGNPIFRNSIIAYNKTNNYGAAILNANSSPDILNSNIVYNHATNANGGAIYNFSPSAPTFTNTVFWKNSINGNSNVVNADANSGATITYSLVQQNSSYSGGTGNIINVNPNFTDGTGGDFSLMIGSSLINGGSNTAWNTGGLTVDFNKNTRPQFSTVDIGAYEMQTDKVYVKHNATGKNNGTSWANAFTDLQDALDITPNGVEIWVAAGTYKPTKAPNGSVNTRDFAFYWNTDIKLYGGFAGTETQLSQRNWNTNKTILSGDLNGDDAVVATETNVTLSNYSNNVYHVLITNNLTSACEINGFVIRGGNADGGNSHFINYGTSSYYANVGGGIVNGASSPSIIHTKILYNYATDGGAAILNKNSNPAFTSMVITHNKTSNYGSALFNENSSPTLLNTNIVYNHAANANGGAVYNSGTAAPIITNTVFWKNTINSNSNVANADANSGATITYSLIPQNSIYASGTNNVANKDPLFTDGANGDFSVSITSPLIHAGSNNAWNAGGLSIDFNQNSRPIGSNIDIGAYEDQCNCHHNHIIGTNAGGNLTSGLGNTVYGEEAGYSLSSGNYNSLLGYQAGYNLTEADSSIFVGSGAGYSTTTGSKNIFMGYLTGYYNTTGYNNLFMGSRAGRFNTTGYNNIALGNHAGGNISTGFDNIVIGSSETAYASYATFSGRDNILIGSYRNRFKTTCSSNVAIGLAGTSGISAGSDLSTGMYNTMLGNSAGGDLSIGNWNTFIGSSAGTNTERTSYNTFVGYNAGFDNNRLGGSGDTNGYNNTYVGSNCGAGIRSGNNNTGFGAETQNSFSNFSNATFMGSKVDFQNDNITLIGNYTIVNGNYGTALGNYTNTNKIGGIGVGYSTLINGDYGIGIGHQDTIRGAYGVSIGYQATVDNQYGIAIGKQASTENDYSLAIGTNTKALGENTIAIGHDIQVSGNHEMYLGNYSTTSIGGTVDYTALSDGRFKTNIKENVVGLDFIRQLRPVTYQLAVGNKQFTVNKMNNVETANCQLPTVYTGFIAQEVEQAALNNNFEFSGVDYRAGIDRYGLRYAEFVVPLVKAIQELQPQIEANQQIIQGQEAQIDAYYQELLELKAELETIIEE